MVDLTLFHIEPDKEYPMQDRLNSRTGPFACYFLEWTGWYNQHLSQRLLGHYRLYQLYKKHPDRKLRRQPLSKSYVLHYQSSHIIKYAISLAVSFVYCIGTLGHPYPAVEIERLNRNLIFDHPGILQEFLENAESDFTSAFLQAMDQCSLVIFKSPHINHSPHIFIRHQQEFHYHQTTFYQSPISPTIPNSPQPSPSAGKAKGVFSKKQFLILFDLFTQAAKAEKLDFSKPNKYSALAELFHAFTGKSQSSWEQELNNYKNKDLYAFHTEGERQQLVNILTNMAELLRKAGFRIIVALIDKKMRELDRHRRDGE